MLISHSKKFIFIHIYKVAGTSISNALSKYCDYSNKTKNPLKRLRQFTGATPKLYINDFDGHIKARDLQNRIPNEIFEKYYKFAFVRNPWDWQVSLYHFALQTPGHHQHQLTKGLGSFEKYLEWRVFEDLNLQKDFVVNERGEIILDYIGKMESINQDFSKICTEIGLPEIQLPHRNKSSRDVFKKYYTPYTSGLIEKYFASDIELFGYSNPW